MASVEIGRKQCRNKTTM